MAESLTGQFESLNLGSGPVCPAKARLLQSTKIRSAATKDSQSPADLLLSAETKDLRTASWNVKGLTTKSEARRETIKVVAETIKRHKFDIVALQEISSDDALHSLCQALNENEINNPWNCASQPIRQRDCLKLGFVWKCDIEIEVHDLPFDYFERRPYHLKFKFEGSTINLVNLHLIQRGNEQSRRNVEISKMTKNKIS